MKSIYRTLLFALLLPWTGLALAAGSGPGAMGDGGMMGCDMGMMMGGFMIVPMLGGLLLLVVLILAIMALVKYLRHG